MVQTKTNLLDKIFRSACARAISDVTRQDGSHDVGLHQLDLHVESKM